MNDTGGDFSVLVADTGSAATTYTDATVAASLTYTYRIKALNAHGVSERSRWFHIDTPAAPQGTVVEGGDADEQGAPGGADEQATEPPAKPTGLTATATHDTVDLTWDAPNDDTITGYMILRRDRDTDEKGEFRELVADTDSAAPTYTDDTVAAGARLTYRIKALNAAGASQRSRWVHIDTLAAPQGTVVEGGTADEQGAPGGATEQGQAAEPPAPPTGLSAEVVAHDTVTLTWDEPRDDGISGYVILRLDFVQSALATVAADTGTTATGYTDDTVEADTLYFYYVQAINARGESELSHYAVARTPADPNPAPVEPPARPTGLASAAASDLVLLSWADPGDDGITGYRILRRRAIADVASDFVTLAEDTGSADTGYADDTVENGRVYVYRVLAIGPGGVSEPSRDVRVRTTTPVAPQEPLTGARAHVSNPSGVLLTNLGQSTSTNTRIGVGINEVALGFTTGSNRGGYNLSRIKLKVAVVPPTPDDVVVELRSATSADPPIPGTLVATLTHATETWTAGNNNFNVPADTTLEADTTYFVFLTNSGSDTSQITGFQLSFTGSTSADVGIAVGWEIGNLVNRTRSPLGAWTVQTFGLGQFEVVGSYVLHPAPPGQNVSEPDGGDCNDDSSTQCRVAVGGWATGNIGEEGDSDWFEVHLEVGHKYQIDLEGVDTSQGTLADPALNGLRGFERHIPGLGRVPGVSDEDSGDGRNSRDTFTVPDNFLAGEFYEFYILVGEDGDNATGTYRLRVREVAGSGYGREMLVEGHLRVGGSLSGTLGVPTDYGTNSYYFALEDLEVGRYTVDFGTGTIDSIHATLRRDAYDDTMIIRAQPDPMGRKGIDSYSFDVRPGMEGTHYVLLEMRMGDSGNYTATLEKAMPSLRVGGPAVEGEIHEPKGNDFPGFSGYMLFFSVDLEAGQKYRVDVEGKDTCDNCTMDHTMLGHIQAPDGSFVGTYNSQLTYGGGEGRNTRYVFTADQDGTHFLKAGGRLFGVGSSINITRYRAGTFKVSIREVR